MPLLIAILLSAALGTCAWGVARRGPSLTMVPVSAIVGGTLVLGVVTGIVVRADGRVGVDADVAGWADRHASALSTDGLQVITNLGAVWFVAGGVLALVLIELRRGAHRWVLPFLLAVVLGDKLLTVALKDLVDRARPTLNPVAQTLGPSFPSGHTSTAAAFWAATALVVGRWCAPRIRAALVGAAVGIAVAVAASRVLLNVHWLTDVIGGLALGWAWSAVCVLVLGGRLRGGRGAALRPGCP